MLLSVITPVFNTPSRYLDDLASSLHAAVDGVAWEWLLVDDHSDDADTLACLDRLAQRPGVVRMTNTSGKGAANTRNTGAAQARGELLAFVDADDIPVPRALAQLAQTMEASPDIRWLAGDYDTFTDEHPPSDPPMASAAMDCVVEHWPDAARRLIFETPFSQGSYVVRRQLFDDVGGFDERFVIGEDWYLWMRLAAQRELYFCPLKVLLVRRGHPSTMASQASTGDAVVAPYLAARRDPLFAAHRKVLRWRIYKLYRLLAERNQAIAQHARATRYAGLSALWGINDGKQWLNLLRAMARKPLR